jgi:ATP-dependent Clp protease ATP-binding subunit ClpB
VDDVVLFKPLQKHEIKQIVGLMTSDLEDRLQQQGIAFEITEEAKDFIAGEGYDPVYGARPLRRFIAREVETPIARFLVARSLGEGSRVIVDTGPEGLQVRSDKQWT